MNTCVTVNNGWKYQQQSHSSYPIAAAVSFHCDCKVILISYVVIMLASKRRLLLHPSCIKGRINVLVNNNTVFTLSCVPHHTAMIAFPTFSPRSIPMKPAGMFSKPFVMCSRHCSLPCRCNKKNKNKHKEQRKCGTPLNKALLWYYINSDNIDNHLNI